MSKVGKGDEFDDLFSDDAPPNIPPEPSSGLDQDKVDASRPEWARRLILSQQTGIPPWELVDDTPLSAEARRANEEQQRRQWQLDQEAKLSIPERLGLQVGREDPTTGTPVASTKFLPLNLSDVDIKPEPITREDAAHYFSGVFGPPDVEETTTEGKTVRKWLFQRPEPPKPSLERNIVQELTSAIADAFQIPARLLRPVDNVESTQPLSETIRDQMRLQFPEMPEDELRKAVDLATDMRKAVEFSQRYGRPMGGYRVVPVWVRGGGEWKLVGASIVSAHGGVTWSGPNGPFLPMPHPWDGATPHYHMASINVPSPNDADNPELDEPDDDEDEHDEEDWTDYNDDWDDDDSDAGEED